MPSAHAHHHLTGLPANQSLRVASASQAPPPPTRPVPSPPQSDHHHHQQYYHLPSTPSASSSTTSYQSPPSSNYSASSSSTIRPDRVRAPNPAKRVPATPANDALRSAVDRDALRDEAARKSPPGSVTNIPTTAQLAASLRKPSATANTPPISPSLSPTMLHHPATQARLNDAHSTVPRNPSIDSTVSSMSALSTSQRPDATGAYRVSTDAANPQDFAAMVAAAGSAEAAIQKLMQDKNQAASHNAQLWKLVEKQRNLILGLNKDLAQALKDKDKYKKRLKEELAQSRPTPSLPLATPHGDTTTAEHRDLPSAAALGSISLATVPAAIRDFSMDSRKVSDTSDSASLGPTRSETPNDASNVPSSVLPATPISTSSAHALSRDVEATTISAHSTAPLAAQRQGSGVVEPASPVRQPGPLTPSSTQPSHRQNLSISSSQGVPTPKQASRKAPPAPLQLSATTRKADVSSVINNIVDASDSEYEDDPDSARADQNMRGRRRTREEDDRERDAQARQDLELRSRSLKEKISKSKINPPGDTPAVAPPDLPASTIVEPAAGDRVLMEERAKVPTYPPNMEPTAFLRQRGLSDAAGALPKSNTAPSLLSPGLPMSPRPGDRPMNSPFPRAPNKMLNSIPMSPRAGLPLSPRAPRQPIPMPPQTPLTFTSPHLARAEQYQTTMPSSLAAQLHASPDPSPEMERPSTSSDVIPMTPGEVFNGLATEQYPDLLLPPNALPSIYVKTASSRMKPSRQSYIAPKPGEENPVFTLAVHERSNNRQLWRVEKTYAALSLFDTQVKAVCAFRGRVPEKALFTGHAPAKIDARRAALDAYVTRMLDAIVDDNAGMVVCKFLSTDAIGAADNGDYFGSSADTRPDTPVTKQRPYREGYLTKRGKNFGGWKARYFVLDGPNLKYFDDLGGAQLGAIKLQNAQIGKQSNNAQNAQEDEDNQFRHAFLVLEPKKKDSTSLVRHVLCAESDEERDMWVESLLQYVDFKDEDAQHQTRGGGVQMAPAIEIGGARSPRLQKSFNDLRPSSRGKPDKDQPPTDHLRAVGYSDTVAGEAPVMFSPRRGEHSSPPSDGGSVYAENATSSHPNISGPTNLQAIPNDWGMKPQPPPTPGKDKKRNFFSQLRGRSSSDLNDKGATLAHAGPPDYFTSGTSRAVFGVPLAEAVEVARPVDAVTDLPAVVYRCIEFLLLRNAVAEEGIFRLSGSNTVIKGLKDRFNTEGDVNLATDAASYDVHAVASLLKLYLRELPSSILTRDLHLDFLKCLELTHREDKLSTLNALIHQLPRANFALLEALSAFLARIVLNRDVNKMNVRNVGIVFAPTLNVPAPLISSFVEDQTAIFAPAPESVQPPVTASEGIPDPRTTTITAAAAPVNKNIPLDLRSPRKQMFQDLPTPAYSQTTFSSLDALRSPGLPPSQQQQLQQQRPPTANAEDAAAAAGLAPLLHPTYAIAPHGDGANYASLNDALRATGPVAGAGTTAAMMKQKASLSRLGGGSDGAF